MNQLGFFGNDINLNEKGVVNANIPYGIPRPFVNWVGGKTRLYPQLAQYLPVQFNTYYEPFVGGGGMSMQFNSPNQSAIDAQIVSIQIINKPTDADARKEGFETAKTLKGYWQKHGLLEGAKIIWAIDFILSVK